MILHIYFIFEMKQFPIIDSSSLLYESNIYCMITFCQCQLQKYFFFRLKYPIAGDSTRRRLPAEPIYFLELRRTLTKGETVRNTY